MQIAFQQGSVNDLKEFLATLDGRSAFHQWRGGGGVRVIQLLDKMTAFL